jgi:hypothetical protein
MLLGGVTPPASAGETIDSVIATVNRRAVLASDWDEAVRFEALLGHKSLAELTEADRIGALQRLIDQQLLASQMIDSGYKEPNADDLNSQLNKLRAGFAGGTRDDVWQRTLASYGLTEPVLRNHLKLELQMMNFIDVRLRPNVRIHRQEVEAYYNDKLLPEIRKNNGKPVPLSEVELKIRELLTQQRVDEMLEAWLHNLRQQAKIQSSVPIPALSASTPPQENAAGYN